MTTVPPTTRLMFSFVRDGKTVMVQVESSRLEDAASADHKRVDRVLERIVTVLEALPQTLPAHSKNKFKSASAATRLAMELAVELRFITKQQHADWKESGATAYTYTFDEVNAVEVCFARAKKALSEIMQLPDADAFEAWLDDEKRCPCSDTADDTKVRGLILYALGNRKVDLGAGEKLTPRHRELRANVVHAAELMGRDLSKRYACVKEGFESLSMPAEADAK
jgi:hypothetical protein